MTSIKEFKEKQLSDMDLESIKGGKWSEWRTISTDLQSGITIQQRFNWWGLNGTSELRQDCDPMI